MKRALETKLGLPAAKTDYLERELRRHFEESWVVGFEPLVPKMTNDLKDRHVLAAAVHAHAPTIVTYNKRDFPLAATGTWGVEAIGPSAFLEELYTQAPAIVIARIRQQAIDLRRGLTEQLTVLENAVPSFVERLRRDLRH